MSYAPGAWLGWVPSVAWPVVRITWAEPKTTERRDAAVIAHRRSLGGAGKFHAVNVPLHDGIDDATYFRIFEPIMREARRMRQAATCSASRPPPTCQV